MLPLRRLLLVPESYSFWDIAGPPPESQYERILQDLEVRRLYFALFPNQIPLELNEAIESQFTPKEQKRRRDTYPAAMSGSLTIECHSKQSRQHQKFKVCDYRGVSSNGSSWKVQFQHDNR